MEENSVSGFFKVCSCFLGSKQNPEISVKECEPDQGETNDVRHLPLLLAVVASEHEISGTEHLRVKELQRLCGQEDEEVWQDGTCTRSPDQTNQDVGFPDGADLAVTEGDADGDVALDRHSSQVQWRVEGGEDGDDQQDEAEGYTDFIQGVADDVEKSGQGQLHHVVYHQVDEQNVTRTRIEDLQDKGSEKKGILQTNNALCDIKHRPCSSQYK